MGWVASTAEFRFKHCCREYSAEAYKYNGKAYACSDFESRASRTFDLEVFKIRTAHLK
jgi:hypothetical protein